jgi:hypothetical protein
LVFSGILLFSSSSFLEMKTRNQKGHCTFLALTCVEETFLKINKKEKEEKGRDERTKGEEKKRIPEILVDPMGFFFFLSVGLHLNVLNL